MGVILTFFRWLDKLLTTALRWLVSLPGQIVLFFTTLVTTISEILSFFVDNIPSLTSMVNNAASQASSLSGHVYANSSYGSLLVHVTSLDVAFGYIVSVGGVFLAMVGALFIVVFCFVITAWVIPFALMVVQKTISVFSAGFVKV